MKLKFWFSVFGGALAGGLLFLVLVALGFFAWMLSLLFKFLVIGAIVALFGAIVVKTVSALKLFAPCQKPLGLAHFKLFCREDEPVKTAEGLCRVFLHIHEHPLYERAGPAPRKTLSFSKAWRGSHEHNAFQYP